MTRWITLVALAASTLTASASIRVDLDGPAWTFRTTLDVQPVPVTVPHCWPTMPAYKTYLGTAIYERDFEAPNLPGKITRIHFDAVYLTSSVWLNGHKLGTHEGGYTAFEYDITSLLKPGKNHLMVEVSNTPTLSTLPTIATSRPSKDRPIDGTVGHGPISGWMPYGGIVRPVTLLITDAIYLRGMKVDTHPNLTTGDATITIRARLHNAANTPSNIHLQGTIAGLETHFKPTRLASNSDTELTWAGTLKSAHLWSLKDPFLYEAKLTVPGDEAIANIGIREIRVQGTQLLLNGHPAHLFGANRVSEDPKEGLRESDQIIERDLSDMLADNMRMMRIAHYPQAQALLDFADAHGMLLIPEGANWNMGAWQLADPGIRALWQKEFRETMEQEWNHPSVIAWSVGNEYESYTKQGIDWTRDMRAYVLGIDPTRLITFASRYTRDEAVKTGKDEASQFSDIVCINMYGGYAKGLDRTHDLYPDKPIFVTEFGKSGEPGTHDPERIANITEAVEAMKARPWVIGGSLWTWNDYRSLIPGTPANGIRNWGVVTFDREHRDSWQAVQKLFATELP